MTSESVHPAQKPTNQPSDKAADSTHSHNAPSGTHKELLQLSGPNIASRLGVMAMGLTDTIVLGHYSSQELGYLALGWAPTSTVLVSGIGLLFGIQVLTARHLGAGEPDKTGAVLRRGLSYAFLIGVISTLLLYFGGPPLLAQIGLDADLAKGASVALQILSLSLTPYLLGSCLWLWLEAQGKPQVPMVVMWAANVVNLVLALWMVPGNSPFPVDGAVAASWVTFMARIVLLLMLGVYVWRWPKARELGVFQRPPRDIPAEREQRRIGYASGLSYAIESGAFAALSFVAARMGTVSVAAWTIIMNLTATVFMVPMGIATATAILVSRNVGAKNLSGIRRSYLMGLGWGTGSVTILSIIVLLVPEKVGRIYSSDPELLQLAVSALQITALFFMADAAQVVTANALRARGDIWWATRMHIVSYLVIMLPSAWVLALNAGFGLIGIVWGVIIASLVSGLALVGRFYWLDKEERRAR